jgi:HK97 gp10 family phage protein
MDDDVVRVDVRGLQQVLERLRQVPDRLERNVVRGGLRAAGREYVKLIRPRIPIRKGTLRKSVRVSAGRAPRGKVLMHVRAGGQGRFGDAWYGRLVEDGTKPHEIKPLNRKALSIGGALRSSVSHPGSRGLQFMRQAHAGGAQPALNAFIGYVEKRLGKLFEGPANAS